MSKAAVSVSSATRPGIVGALIGDWLLHRLGIHFGSGIIGLIINATIGAIGLLLALRLTGASGSGGR